MSVVTIHAAKTNLSQLISLVEAGEEVVVARGKEPVVKLVPLRAAASKRRIGALRGQLTVDASFFDPLPEEELAAWG